MPFAVCCLLTSRDSFGLTWSYHNFQHSHFREARIILPENAESDPLAGYLQGADLRFDRRVIVALALLILTGLAFRVVQLGAIGFAEDEVNKVDAIRAY